MNSKVKLRITLTLHIAVFVIYMYSLIYDLLYIGLDEKSNFHLFTDRGYGGKFKFLTFIGFLLQTAYFGVSVANDVLGSHVRPSYKGAKKTGLQKFTDTFLASLIYPVGTFVVMTFWGIYAVDRELVYPKRLDAIIPSWLNHVMHTTVLPILLVEKYLIYHEYPKKRKGLSVLLGFALGYLVWILWVAYYADIWVYPVLQVMEPHQRVIFITVLLAFFVSIYILGEALNAYVWRKEISIKNQKLKPKKLS